jgi:hypothetical protein
MNQRTPADPTPLAEKEVLISAFAPRAYPKMGEPAAGPAIEQPAIEPRKSFFRGVAVGIGIMIPIWAWLILRFVN